MLDDAVAIGFVLDILPLPFSPEADSDATNSSKMITRDLQIIAVVNLAGFRLLTSGDEGFTTEHLPRLHD